MTDEHILPHLMLDPRLLSVVIEKDGEKYLATLRVSIERTPMNPTEQKEFDKLCDYLGLKTHGEFEIARKSWESGRNYEQAKDSMRKDLVDAFDAKTKEG